MLFRATRPAPPEPEQFLLQAGGEDIVIRLRRNPRARRYTLRVRTAERDVVLTMPPRGSAREAQAFARKYSEWIAVRLARLPKGVAFAPSALVPLRGTPHRLVHRPKTRGTVWTEVAPDGPAICVAGDRAHFSRRVGDFLKREAKADLVAASRRHAAALKVAISRVTLRDTASRWGSCSASGGLSYSWRLIMAPSFVLDYLAAHEVAHRCEMNHGPAFWKTVDALYPGRERAERWLKVHGPELHRYGVEEE